MAEALDIFRKRFAALKDRFSDALTEADREARFTTHLLPAWRAGFEEFALRVGELKAGGQTGTKPSDFLGDKEAKAIYARLEEMLDDYASFIDKHDTEMSKYVPLLRQFEQLQKDVHDEIADRKKKVTTKLGIGNKSVPEMERLMAELQVFEERDKGYAAVEQYRKEDIASYRKEMATELGKLIAKTKSQVHGGMQNEKYMQLLDVRVLAGALNRARKLHDSVVDAGKKAASAGYDKAAVATITKASADFLSLVVPYEHAIDDDRVKQKLEESKYKQQINGNVAQMSAMKADVIAELTRAKKGQAAV